MLNHCHHTPPSKGILKIPPKMFIFQDFIFQMENHYQQLQLKRPCNVYKLNLIHFQIIKYHVKISIILLLHAVYRIIGDHHYFIVHNWRLMVKLMDIDLLNFGNREYIIYYILFIYIFIAYVYLIYKFLYEIELKWK